MDHPTRHTLSLKAKWVIPVGAFVLASLIFSVMAVTRRADYRASQAASASCGNKPSSKATRKVRDNYKKCIDKVKAASKVKSKTKTTKSTVVTESTPGISDDNAGDAPSESFISNDFGSSTSTLQGGNTSSSFQGSDIGSGTSDSASSTSQGSEANSADSFWNIGNCDDYDQFG